MRNAFTKRNHYNPCFWTAYWNPVYFEAALNDNASKLNPREQQIFCLNARANKVLPTIVENVHYDKELGVAEITQDQMKRFCKSRFPAEYEQFYRNIENHPETLYLDFEDILSGIENKGVYNSLMEVIRRGGLASVEHKGFLSCLLAIHALRSHEVMNSMLDAAAKLGIAKFEYFWLLKNAWSNPYILARAVTPLALSQWVLYRTEEHCFPLCDSPVMVGKSTVMVVLSPRLLLEINLNVPFPEDRWIERAGVSASKFREFRRRAINNTFKEIIFHSAEELDRWRRLPEFISRSTLLSDAKQYDAIIGEAAGRVLWAIDGFGRVPPDFERRIRHSLLES